MSEAPKLKPCPFCGGGAAKPWFNGEESDGGRGEVYCSVCSSTATGGYVSWVEGADARLESVGGAITAWNTRADLIPAWQPIETAPTDGLPVIVGWDGGFWHSLIAHKEGRFWGVLGGDMEFTILQKQPTHWMPIPNPPVAL